MRIILVGPRVVDSKSKKELTKKQKIISFSQNTNFFGNYRPYNKLDHAQHAFKKTWYYMLQRVFDLPFLLKIHG
jgi:hypothetical protein